MRENRPGIVTAGLLPVAAQAAWAGPKADLWRHRQAHDPRSETTVDHSPRAEFLQRYLVVHEDGANRVRYAQVDDDERDVIAHALEYAQPDTSTATTTTGRSTTPAEAPFKLGSARLRHNRAVSTPESSS